MGYFTPEQANALAQKTVKVSLLVELQFASGTMRLWNGFSALTTGGQTFRGLGGVGQIDGLQSARQPTSNKVEIGLSGVDPQILGIALGSVGAVQGQLAVIYLQLFDENWQPEGGPIPLWAGVMQAPRVTRAAMSDGGEGTVQSVTLTIENIFYRRVRVPAGRYTDRDQQARFPGDRFFQYVPNLVNKTITWPDYG